MTAKLTKGSRKLTLQIPEELLQSADQCSETLGADRHTVLLGWLQAGAEKGMLQLAAEGKLSAGKLVELLGITYHDLHPLAHEHGIALGATDEQVQYMGERYGRMAGEMLKPSLNSRKE